LSPALKEAEEFKIQQEAQIHKLVQELEGMQISQSTLRPKLSAVERRLDISEQSFHPLDNETKELAAAALLAQETKRVVEKAERSTLQGTLSEPVTKSCCVVLSTSASQLSRGVC
jgi:hypothetical protein